MKYLLGTNAWIWLAESPEKLSPKTMKVVRNFKNAPFGLSAISLWELAKKVSLGKIILSMPLDELFERIAREPFIEVVPLTAKVALESTQLPGNFHNDPADQIIAATARVHGLTLVTKDKLLLDYPHVKTLW